MSDNLGARPDGPGSQSSPIGADPSRCSVPPEGWWCSRAAGHDGPCAARPTRETFEALWESADELKRKRAIDMPTEQDAIRTMMSAYERLKELGWNDPIYCPKDGSSFDVIEVGSTGIHRAHYQGEWPTGSWWIEDAGDLWPSRPTMYRRTEAEKAKWAKLRAAFRDSDRSGEAGETGTGSTEGDSAGLQGIAQPESRNHLIATDKGGGERG